MSRHDKIGGIVLAGLLLLLVGVLIWARPWDPRPARPADDNMFIKFHIQKIENSKNP